MKKLHRTFLGFFLFILFLTSCDNYITEDEKKTIERYTKQEQHDSLLVGKWKNNIAFIDRGKTMDIFISFDEKGGNYQKYMENDKTIYNWSLDYYYHTKQGKIFFYRPAEKGFMAMDGEIFVEHEYEISQDGKSLTIIDETYGNKNYIKVDLE